MKPRVLFLCTANSCRSQMAEGWLRALAAGRVEALSAGTHPTRLHPLALRVMGEVGIDLSGQHSKALPALLEPPPELVIAVCDQAAACARAELPPGVARLCWPFEDPARAVGAEDEVLPAFRRVRDEIHERIRAWIEDGLPGLPVASPTGA